MQKAEIDYLTPFIKINLKWIKNLNIRPETVKCLDENIAEKLLDIGFGNNFQTMIPKETNAKAKLNKLLDIGLAMISWDMMSKETDAKPKIN